MSLFGQSGAAALQRSYPVPHQFCVRLPLGSGSLAMFDAMAMQWVLIDRKHHITDRLDLERMFASEGEAADPA